MRIDRRVGTGLILVASALALVAPVALGQRAAAHARPPTGNIANGFRVFNDYFCADCHVMKAAGSASYRGYNVCNGDTACGPGINFNKIPAPYQVAIAAVTNGLPAAPPPYPTQMPSFRKVLTKTQIQDVAAFLNKYSGGYKTCNECQGITPSGVPTSSPAPVSRKTAAGQ
jgi:mono/diheme cytochrome c family protein